MLSHLRHTSTEWVLLALFTLAGLIPHVSSDVSSDPSPHVPSDPIPDPLKIPLKIGLVWDYTQSEGPPYAAVYSLQAAVRYVNSRDDILNGTFVSIVKQDTTVNDEPNPAQAIKAAYNVSTSGVIAVIGPETTDEAVYAALVTSGFKIPTCFTLVGGTQFSDRATYANTFRMTRTVRDVGIYLVQYVMAMGWNRVAYLHSAQLYGTAYIQPIVNAAANQNVTLLAQSSFNTGVAADDDAALALVRQSDARIIIVTGTDIETTLLWTKAHRAGLVTPDHVWVTSNGIIDAASADSPYFNISIRNVLGKEEAANNAVVSVVITDMDQTTDAYKTYLDNFWQVYTNTTDTALDEWYYYSQDMIWDCAMSVFYGYDAYLKNNNLSATLLSDPDFTKEEMKGFSDISNFNTSIQGLTGPYNFDSNGDIMYEHVQIQLQSSELNYPVVADFLPTGLVLYPENFLFYGGSKTVPLDFPPLVRLNPVWKTGEGAGFAFLSALLLSTNIASLIAVVHLRHKVAIKRASWKSLAMILVGLTVADVAPLLYIGELSTGVCVLQPFVLNVAFGLVFSNLMAKTFRVYKIFNNPRMMEKPMKDIHLLSYSAGLVGVELLISLIWVLASKPVPTDIMVSATESVLTCVSPNAKVQRVMTAISIAFNGLLLALTTLLSYKTRGVVSAFNETKWIGLSVYNLVAVCSLFLPLVYTTTFATMAFTLRSIGILLGTGVTQLCIFGPKFLQLYQDSQTHAHARKDTSAQISSMASSRANQSKMSLAQLPKGHRPKEGASSSGRKVGGFQIPRVPTLIIASGGSLFSFRNFITGKWAVTNVSACPGYLLLEDVDVEAEAAGNAKPGVVRVFRTDRATLRDEAGTVESRAASQAHMEKRAEPAAQASNSGPSTLTIGTVDGTVQLVLHAKDAKELAEFLHQSHGKKNQGATMSELRSGNANPVRTSQVDDV
ncbi:periplasmic binding protein-like I [Fimicolochytrium jonesii]|uniref:periplasmic binding protein-like I n=1 Tax=Fimicolochytrium jonesii TaxID=1396493 RepID=UPI0022FEBEA1|nr:periplasmic binding protein-like I [Fimicolochytrium jonesii]KAI8820079.1 periplasmic binding protein-like I [Fimicolochytrium jonesii]